MAPYKTQQEYNFKLRLAQQSAPSAACLVVAKYGEDIYCAQNHCRGHRGHSLPNFFDDTELAEHIVDITTAWSLPCRPFVRRRIQDGAIKPSGEVQFKVSPIDTYLL